MRSVINNYTHNSDLNISSDRLYIPLRVMATSPPRVYIIFLIIQRPFVNYSLLNAYFGHSLEIRKHVHSVDISLSFQGRK